MRIVRSSLALFFAALMLAGCGGAEQRIQACIERESWRDSEDAIASSDKLGTSHSRCKDIEDAGGLSEDGEVFEGY